ncbi:hypothetical protein Daus18300_005004 [Diaporthe australafricana]|uniref:Peptidase M3A/M3B catalytic domain-containing protein n=1 Tax=Diaporthe australafricana TaxID=127596 RepID=A0ABR3X413_9PEZI
MASLAQPLPRFPKVGDIIPTIETVIAQHEGLRNNLVKIVTFETAHFDNVVRPLAELDNNTQAVVSAISVLEELTGSSEAVQAGNLWKQAQNGWKARGDLFKLLDAVNNKNEDLEPESKLWLEKELLGYTLAGHGRLSEAQIEEFKQARAEIDKLVSKFSRNSQKNKGGVWYGGDELAGVPEDKIAEWEEATSGHEEASDNQKKIFVPFSNGGWLQILKFAKLENSRRRMLIAYEKGPQANADIVRELFLRRDSQARLLGFSSHADMRSLTTAVKSVDWVRSFLSDLKEAIIPKQTEAIKKARSVLAGDQLEHRILEKKGGDDFAPWNVFYCSRLVQASMHVDQAKVAEYFPIDHTTKYMLQAFASYLSLEFVQVPSRDVPPECTWHDDVEVWSVWDKRNKPAALLGYLYLDLMWRENKSTGYFNLEIQCGHEKTDGTRHCPSTLLSCSFETSREGNCPTLAHDKVVLLYHDVPELGHAIHDLVSKTKYVRFHGTRLADDFCEMPSVMLENWCWQREILKDMSHHYTAVDETYLSKWQAEIPSLETPPTKIPDEIVASLLHGRGWVKLNQILIQLTNALLDMEVHDPSSHQALADMDIGGLHNALRSEVRGLSNPGHESYPYPNFHIIVRGYDAVSYSYLAAEAYAQDVYRTIFAMDPTDKQAWDRYRRGVLEWGVPVLQSSLGTYGLQRDRFTAQQFGLNKSPLMLPNPRRLM